MADASDSSGDGGSDPALAVVTVAFRSDGVLPAFLRSIEAATSGPAAIVIVDNDPHAGSETAGIAASAGARYVPRADNPGYGAAINAGVATVPDSVRWVVICNPDLEFAAGTIDALIAVAAADERVGSAGPTIVTPEGAVYPSARPIPSLRMGIGHALFANIWTSNPWSARYKQTIDRSAPPRPVGWLSGSCLLVRRTAFEEIGGFDEGYFMYFEDVDLGFRLSRAGYTNVVVPHVSAVHVGGHATRTVSARMVKAHHDSAKRFLTRKYAGPALAPVRAVLRAGLSVRSALQQRAARRGSGVR